MSFAAHSSSILATTMPAPHRKRARALSRASILLGLALALLAPRTIHAQSARASFFLQMLRQNPDARVRLSAALRLGELRESATVDPLVQVLSAEREPTVQAAVVSALAAIGDPRALPAVQAATHSPSSAVNAQARRAVATLQAVANASGGSSGSSGSSGGGTSSGARFLIGVGSVNNQSGVSQLQQVAQQALQTALQQRPQVVMHTGAAAAAQRAMRAQNLRGHYFDANIQSVQPRAGGVRAAVSIAVSTLPGRAFEFDYQAAITIMGSSGDPAQTQQDAVRRAVESAVNHALDQLAQMP
jgi:hypothetical protein